MDSISDDFITDSEEDSQNIEEEDTECINKICKPNEPPNSPERIVINDAGIFLTESLARKSELNESYQKPQITPVKILPDEEDNLNSRRIQETLDQNEFNDNEIISARSEKVSSRKPSETTNDIPDSEWSKFTREILSKLQSTILFGDSRLGITINELNSELPKMTKSLLKQFIGTIRNAIKYQHQPGYLEHKNLVSIEKKIEKSIDFNKEMKIRLRKLDSCFDSSHKNPTSSGFSKNDIPTYTKKLSNRIHQLQNIQSEIQKLQIENLQLQQSISSIFQPKTQTDDFSLQKQQILILEVELTKIQQNHRSNISKFEADISLLDPMIKSMEARIEEMNKRILIERRCTNVRKNGFY